MSDVRDRAKLLMVEARRARILRERLATDGEDTADLDRVIGDLQGRLGAMIVAEPELAALLVPMIPEPPPSAKESFTDELVTPTRAGGWYEEEKTGPIETTGPLFDTGDLVTGEIPIPDDLHLPRESDDTDAGENYAVETTASMRARAEDPHTGLGSFRTGTAPFAAPLREFLELLRSPYDLDDATELGVEASRVQWAAGELETRTRDLPKDVKVALTGLVASRAQNLRARVDVDVGIRRGLDRLQRFRIERELPAVHGLLPTPVPENATWLEDAEEWWAVFFPPSSAP